MKKVTLAILFLSAFFVTTANAASLNIQRGDTLSELAEETGFTIRQLVAMNDGIEDPDVIYAGSSLVYFDQDDLKKASAWCRQRMQELWPSNREHEHFAYVLEDIKENHFRFSINEPNGTHYSSILVYAKAFEKNN